MFQKINHCDMRSAIKKLENFLCFATPLSLLIVTTTTSESSHEVLSSIVESLLQRANKINTKPVCATIYLENATEPSISLYQRELVNRAEFDNIRVNKLKKARFSVGKDQNDLKHCRMQICGFSISKDDWGECENFSGNVTAPDEIFGNDFEVTSVSCSCNPDSDKDTCHYSNCTSEHETQKWKTSECAVLYEETGCQSCYFFPIILQNNTNFNSSNSYQIHSAIVRPGCLLRKRYTGFFWYDNEPGYRNFTNIADNTLPGFHKDAEDFYCLCPFENENSTTITTTTTPTTRPTTTTTTTPITTTTTTPTTTTKTTTTTPTSEGDNNGSVSTTETSTTTENPQNKNTMILVISIPVSITGIVVIGLLTFYLKRKCRKQKPCSKSASISINDKLEVQTVYSENIEPCLSYIADEIQKLSRHFVSSDQLKTHSQDIMSNRAHNCPQTCPKFELISIQFKTVCQQDRILSRNRFTILDSENPLGSGEFGIVYKGLLHTENSLSWQVAVKKIKWKETHETVVESFIRELNIFQSVGIGHEHIVGFMGACCHSDGLYLLTEYCDGGSLRQTLLSEYRPKYLQHETYSIEIPDATKDLQGSSYLVLGTIEQKIMDQEDLYQLLLWCEQIASGMEFLSSKRIIHVDLAARNILLTSDKTVKICDLGLSRKCLGGASGAKSLILGQFPFHSYAPELISDGESGPVQVTLYVDIWAYGCTLWELFTLGSSLYPSVMEEGFERIIKIRELILEGYRHPKPELASEFVYEKLLECWNEIPRDRPSFTKLRDFFKAKCLEFS